MSNPPEPPQPEPTVPDLALKHRCRDELIRQVWVVMRDISDHNDESQMSAEDLDVWDAVTRHSAIQSRLDAAFKKSPTTTKTHRKIMSIQQQAMLVDITFGLPRQSVKLETVSRSVEQQNNAEEGVVRSSGFYFRKRDGRKILDGLRLLKQFQNSWANELKYFARYPFAGGFKLLPAPLLQQFMTTNQRFIDSENELWNNWSTSEYPQWASSAPQRMGALYNSADFPSLDECRASFVCEVTVIPMAPVDQWRHITALAPDIAAAMQQKEEAAIQRVTRESHAKLWADIMSPLKNVVDQLGKDKTRIHETLIENVTKIAALVPAYNSVLKDEALESLASQVMQTLSRITPDDLRKDNSVRDAALKTAAQLVAEFDPYARSFELDDEDAPPSPAPEQTQQEPEPEPAGEPSLG